MPTKRELAKQWEVDGRMRIRNKLREGEWIERIRGQIWRRKGFEYAPEERWRRLGVLVLVLFTSLLRTFRLHAAMYWLASADQHYQYSSANPIQMGYMGRSRTFFQYGPKILHMDRPRLIIVGLYFYWAATQISYSQARSLQQIIQMSNMPWPDVNNDFAIYDVSRV